VRFLTFFSQTAKLCACFSNRKQMERREKMERGGNSGGASYDFDGTTDSFDGLPEELTALRVRFFGGRLIIPRDSRCTYEPLTSHAIKITTPDGEDFIVLKARFVEWEG